MSRKLSLGLIVGLVTIFGVAGAPTAQAATCGYSYQQPFASWGDYGYYGLAQNGSLEGGNASGWTLSGGAGVSKVNGGNPYGSGKYSLSLPAGSSATSPSICVEAGSPWARMFDYTTVRNASVGAALKVELIYTDASTGKSTTRPVTTLAQRSAWSPSELMALGGPVSIKAGSDGRTMVRYKFTPLYSTAWKIDDLFIDPKRH